jgi:Type IV secretion-system coupling protein DNA-binding domain
LRNEVLAVDPRSDRAFASAATLVLVCCTCAAVTDPGIGVGAVLAWWFWNEHRAPAMVRWTFAIVLGAVAFELRSWAVVGWPWRVAAVHWDFLQRLHVAPEQPTIALAGSVTVELLVGPLVFELARTASGLLDRTMFGRLRYQRRQARKRRYAVSGAPLKTTQQPAGENHGPMVLGIDRETRQPFELSTQELEQHVFIPGAAGSGKTTTLSRLAFEALRKGFGVVIIDCKGADLKETARKLAVGFKKPFFVVDPDDPASLGYDPCTGDGNDVSNRLVGSFTFGQNAEIYKLAAQNILPILVEALRSQTIPVTLAALEEHLDPGPMMRMAHDCNDRLRLQLIRLSKPQGAAADGYAGFQLRLGALIRGKFGPLLGSLTSGREMLDWERATARQAVTYIPLRATASPEDVELMGRVIAQDLKQLIARRLQRTERQLPVLVIVDEFAALREASQFVDLLLQSRQAAMSVVLATQYLPETESIRKAALSAGLLIAHRLESSDAKDVAEQFGTRSHYEDVVQIGPDGPTGLRSVRLVDAYRVHPNDLRDMQRGYAAVRSVSTKRRVIVQIAPI